MDSSDQPPFIGQNMAVRPGKVQASFALFLSSGRALLHRNAVTGLFLTAILSLGASSQAIAYDDVMGANENTVQSSSPDAPSDSSAQATASVASLPTRKTRHQLWVGLDGFYIDSYLRGSSTRRALSLMWNYSPIAQHPLKPSIGLGARLATPATYSGNMLELYLRPSVSHALGFWNPTMGIELGLTPFTLFDPTPRGISDSAYQQESDHQTPFYVALHAAPARFQWKRLSVSVLEVQWGTPVIAATKIARMHVGLLQIGWTL